MEEILNKINEKLSKSQIKKMKDKFDKTGKLPPHLMKLAKLMDKHTEVRNIVVPGLEWMSKLGEGKLTEDYKNSEWEVYLRDEKGNEKIVKKAKSKRAATILYNRIVKSDDYYEVGMRAIKEGKLTEKYKTPKMSKKDWRKIAKFKKHIGQDGTHYITKLDRKLGTILVPVIVEEKLDEACQKGYKTHPTRKTKIMFGKRYRNCIKAEDIESLSEDKIYSKADGLKKVKSVSKKGKVYKVDKQKAKYSGKNITMYTLYTKYKNHTSGQNPFGLDMARNSKGEAMYLVPIKEGTLTESGKEIAKTILQQLGGNKFIAMTGAKNLGLSNKGLQMKIGRNSKGVTHVIIELDRGRDLYNIEFVKVRNFKRQTIKKLKGIYADQLGKIFTKYTGLRIRL